MKSCVASSGTLIWRKRDCGINNNDLVSRLIPTRHELSSSPANTSFITEQLGSRIRSRKNFLILALHGIKCNA